MLKNIEDRERGRAFFFRFKNGENAYVGVADLMHRIDGSCAFHVDLASFFARARCSAQKYHLVD